VRILVLGGTRFLGRMFVYAAQARGHEVTLFNRGRTNPEVHRGVERLTGDRDGGLSALAGRTLASSGLRAASGVSVVAIGRHEELLSNPGPDELIQTGDRVAVIGTPSQVAAAERLLGR